MLPGFHKLNMIFNKWCVFYNIVGYDTYCPRRPRIFNNIVGSTFIFDALFSLKLTSARLIQEEGGHGHPSIHIM